MAGEADLPAAVAFQRQIRLVPLDQMAKTHIDTRCMIENPQGKTEVNSRQEIVTNADGSVRPVFSPARSDGVPEANWIQTDPKRGFFAYFRWYSPTKAFFDRSWKMGNIKEMK